MNKMVINHIEKLFVTNDAATIMREIEVSLLEKKTSLLNLQYLHIYLLTNLDSTSGR